MNGLKRAAITLVMLTGISLGVSTAPAIATVTSGRHPGAPDVLHCC
jgi:hypothetical protein